MTTNSNTSARISVKQLLIQRLGSMLTSIKLVFSHWTYIALGGAIATIFWIVFNIFDQLLFFSPIVVFYLPEEYFFSGSSIGVLSSTCASCSSLGFLLISTLGGAGITLSTFLSNYQTPLRIVSIALLLWAYYSISIRLTRSCNVVCGGTKPGN
jgi:hypothetical protein